MIIKAGWIFAVTAALGLTACADNGINPRYETACKAVLATDMGVEQCASEMERVYRGPADAKSEQNAAAQISSDLHYPLR